MKPLPATQELFAQLIESGSPELPAALLEIGRRIPELAPECVGLSLGIVDEGLTMTLVSSGLQVAQIDTTQYLDDGPCVAAVESGETVSANMDDLLDEGRWLLYAQLSAANGVASSLSLPITVDGQVAGSINLYGSTADAFEGRHEAIAAAIGATAETAVTNADLSFSTRLRAAEAPARFIEQRDVDIALGVIAERHALSIDEAAGRLRHAAARALADLYTNEP